jgi:ATP-dependent helicase/nuclease subunit A
VPRNSDDGLKAIKEEIKDIITDLKDYCIYQNEEEIRNELVGVKDYVKTLINILLDLINIIDDYKKEEGIYDFIDIAKLAIKVVAEHIEARDYYKNKFNEILIDEYQDTSDLQELFVSYIAKDNVYVVGDIKQSIYRFRNANPYLFMEKYTNYANHKNGLKIDLNKNFRSRSEVIDSVNNIFDFIMDEYLGGANYRDDSRLVFGNTSYQSITSQDNNIELLNYEYNPKSLYSKSEMEIFAIADDIKKKIDNHFQIMDKETGVLRDCSYSDFAILIDRAVDFELYKKIFEYLHIPLNVLKEESISKSVDVALIKHLFRLLLKINNQEFDEKFKYSFISIARSFLFRYSDDEIFTIVTKETYQETEIYKLANSLVDKVNTESINVILDELLETFDYYNKLVRVGSVDEHITAIDYVVNTSKGLAKFYSVSDFCDYLDNISEGKLDIKFNVIANEYESVRIQTIHKSKGLEYPICYYAGLDKEFNIKDIQSSYLFNKEFGFIIPSLNNKTLITKYLFKNKYYLEEISEKIRLFYVALTRAREKMIIVAPFVGDYNNSSLIVPNVRRLKYRSFLAMLESVYPHIKKYIRNIDVTSLLTKDYNLTLQKQMKKIKEGDLITTKDIRIKKELINTDKFSKEVHEISNIEDKSKLEFGLGIHEVMEYLDLKNPDYSLIPDEYKNLAKGFVESGVLEGVTNYYQEYEFYYDKDDTLLHGIIDLVLEYDDKITIVDYKLKNILDEGYVKQLNGYRDYLKTITDKPISIALYSMIEHKLDYLEINDESN